MSGWRETTETINCFVFCWLFFYLNVAIVFDEQSYNYDFRLKNFEFCFEKMKIENLEGKKRLNSKRFMMVVKHCVFNYNDFFINLEECHKHLVACQITFSAMAHTTRSPSCA